MRDKTRTTSRSHLAWTALLGLTLVLLVPVSSALARGGGNARHAQAVSHRKHEVKLPSRSSHRSHPVHSRQRYVATRRVSREVRVVHARRTVVVPHRIGLHHAPVYRPYYQARVYHPGHGHFHALYRFPVAGPRGVVYESHAYCEGSLFVGAGFPIGRGYIQLGLRF